MSKSLVPLGKIFRMAVMAGVERAVQIHIDRGDDLNARDNGGRTPLMLAASKNKSNICKMLLKAGANVYLTDVTGKTAYMIAVETNALLTVEILKSLISPSESILKTDTNGIRTSDLTLGYADDLDLSGWEAETVSQPPVIDTARLQVSITIQAAISDHKPIDNSEDWDDFALYLPDRSIKFIQKDDTEVRGYLRLLLLRAFREGSIPSSKFDKLFSHQIDSDYVDTSSLLCMIVNELGAEVDERLENDSDVEIDIEETAIEEEVINDAFEFMDSLESRQFEPLRIYQRDIQKNKLISSDEEIVLGKTMELGIESALVALASWSDGIEYILTTSENLRGGHKLMSLISDRSVVNGTQTEETYTEADEVNVEFESLTIDELEDDLENALGP